MPDLQQDLYTPLLESAIDILPEEQQDSNSDLVLNNIIPEQNFYRAHYIDLYNEFAEEENRLLEKKSNGLAKLGVSTAGGAVLLYMLLGSGSLILSACLFGTGACIGVISICNESPVFYFYKEAELRLQEAIKKQIEKKLPRDLAQLVMGFDPIDPRAMLVQKLENLKGNDLRFFKSQTYAKMEQIDQQQLSHRSLLEI